MKYVCITFYFVLKISMNVKTQVTMLHVTIMLTAPILMAVMCVHATLGSLEMDSTALV